MSNKSVSMVRKFNYTNRIGLKKPRPKVRLYGELGDIQTFSVDMNFTNYNFPEDARVYVEAYKSRPPTYRRYDFGTIKEPTQRGPQTLPEFQGTDGMLFRVKVVSTVEDERGDGILLGEADQIRPKSPGDDEQNRTSLLWICSDDIGERLWKLSFDDKIPKLIVSNKLSKSERRLLVKKNEFIVFAYPTIIESVLTEILIEGDDDIDFTDGTDWKSLWMKYICKVLGCPKPPKIDPYDASEFKEWIDEVVLAFCKANKINECFNEFWEEDRG